MILWDGRNKRRIGDVINYASDMYEAVKDADA